tara:strand:- start:2316 stop:2708 length:393 start_codon:yes stop_codon:yes gene_type:complete
MIAHIPILLSLILYAQKTSADPNEINTRSSQGKTEGVSVEMRSPNADLETLDKMQKLTALRVSIEVLDSFASSEDMDQTKIERLIEEYERLASTLDESQLTELKLNEQNSQSQGSSFEEVIQKYKSKASK